MTWGNVAGAAISVGGSMLSGSGSPDRPKFRPYDATSSLGTADWDRKGRTLNTTLSGEGREYELMYGDMARRYMTDAAPTNPYKQFAFGNVQGQVPGLYQGALDASQMDSRALSQYNQQLAGYGGLFNTLGMQAGMAPEARSMYGMGAGLLGNDYSGVMNDRLALLRQQAAPFESRAFNANNQNLFSTGRMGTTGGGLQTEAFARGLAQADTSRQLDAMGFAEQLYGRDQQAGINMMGTGLEGIFGGMGLAGDMFGRGAGVADQMFGANTMYNEMGNQRALQRLQQAQNIFGFGANLDKADQTHGAAGIAGVLGLNTAMQDQARMALQPAAIRAGTQVGAPSSNPLGSALGSLGTSVSNGAFDGLFNKYDYGAWRDGAAWNPSGSMAGSPNINTNVDTGFFKMPDLGG
jgi:hypothetical protein